MSKLLLEHEVEELACLILGRDASAFGRCEINNLLYEKFGVGFQQFQKIASALIMFTLPFERDDGKHYCFIVNHGESMVAAIARIIVEKDGK